MFAVPDNTLALPADRAEVHPVRIARDLAEDRTRWAHLLRYDPDERWAALLDDTGEYEVWLLSWLPGQHTDLHDHGGATGAFTVVSGVLTERAVRFGTAAGTNPAGANPAGAAPAETVPSGGAGGATESLHVLTAGRSRAFGPDYAHRIRNDGPDPAISIHVYRPARAMTSYTVDPLGGLTPR